MLSPSGSPSHRCAVPWSALRCAQLSAQARCCGVEASETVGYQRLPGVIVFQIVVKRDRVRLLRFERCRKDQRQRAVVDVVGDGALRLRCGKGGYQRLALSSVAVTCCAVERAAMAAARCRVRRDHLLNRVVAIEHALLGLADAA
jgi:hypothetical protein